MKRSILFSLMIIAAAAIVTTGVGTFAYFSDNGSSTANTFTSGTLDVQLSNDGVGGWSNDVSATWVSPAGWAPGDSFIDSLTFRNVGTVAAHSGLIDFQNGGCDGPNMFEKIEVTKYEESFDAGATYFDNVPGLVGVFDTGGPGDGKLSLWELINGDTTTPGTQSPSPYDLAIYTPHPTLGDLGAWGNNDDELPFGNPDILPANQGQVYIMRMEFKFMEEAGNAYQGVTCTLNINTKFVQIPGVRPWTDITLSDGNPTGY